MAGNFDVELRFSPGSAGPPSADAPQASSIDDAPAIFTAVRQQLGLKPTPAKAPMDRLVIDHIEPPARIEAGTMEIILHLCVNGNCDEAFRFYAQSFGGAIGTMLTYGASPAAGQFPPDMHDRILHASLLIGDQELTGVDVPPNTNISRHVGFTCCSTLKVRRTRSACSMNRSAADTVSTCRVLSRHHC